MSFVYNNAAAEVADTRASRFKSVQAFVIVYRKFVIGFANFDAAITHETIDLTEPLFVSV